MYEVEGVVHHVSEVETFKNDFTKRKVVISKNMGDKVDYTVLSLIKEKCSLVKSSDVGSQVKAKFYVNGNEYQGKWYVDLNCASIDVQREAKPFSGNAKDIGIPADVQDQLGKVNTGFLDDTPAKPFIAPSEKDDLPF